MNKLFAVNEDGLLGEIPPELAEQSRQSMRYRTVSLTIDVLFTPEEEAERDAEEAAERERQEEAQQAINERAAAAEEKLAALGLTKEDLKALL